jgi:tRNA/rRNA methyltransferase
VLPWLFPLPQASPGNPNQHSTSIHSAIIFGREDHGLSNIELDYAQRYLYIPSHPAYPSLNLAQAVGICCYELAQLATIAPTVDGETAIDSPSPSSSASSTPINPASLDQLEAYFNQLEELLLTIGYLHPHTAVSRMATLRDLAKRSDPSHQEVAMLRGMIRQIKWAIAHADQVETLTERQ